MDAVQCSICLSDVRQPIETNCRHVFCFNCMKQVCSHWEDQSAVRCPNCRQLITLMLPYFNAATPDDALEGTPDDAMSRTDFLTGYNGLYSVEPTQLRHFLPMQGLRLVARIRQVLWSVMLLIKIINLIILNLIPEQTFFNLIPEQTLWFGFVVVILLDYLSLSIIGASVVLYSVEPVQPRHFLTMQRLSLIFTRLVTREGGRLVLSIKIVLWSVVLLLQIFNIIPQQTLLDILILVFFNLFFFNFLFVLAAELIVVERNFLRSSAYYILFEIATQFLIISNVYVFAFFVRMGWIQII